MREHELAEFEIEQRPAPEDPEGRGRHAMTLPAAAPATRCPQRRCRRPRQRPCPRPPRRLPPVAADSEIELAVVKSPIVGTFYRSPRAGAPSFVEIGSTVKKGQVLCIIEAMKLMNEIDSEYDGEIVNVYVENGQPVQYGERLFAIRTNRPGLRPGGSCSRKS